jgi:hypothetical protein
MKIFIGNMLAKILDKMGFTVIIGCKVNGDIHTERNNQLFYSNNFSDTKLFYQNGQEFELPEGKFKIKSTLNKESNRYIDWYKKVVNKNNRNGEK